VSESNPPVALRQATSEANLVFPLKPAGKQKQKQEKEQDQEQTQKQK
jgi:hypothetical protein